MIEIVNFPDDPNRVEPPDDDFDESKWIKLCDKCSRPLYEGDAVYMFDGLPFQTVCYCEDCLEDIRRIL